MRASSSFRLRVRDLSALAAFSSVAISGQLEWALIGLAGAGFALALAGRRPFGDHNLLGGLFLLAAAAVAFGSVLFGKTDLVVGACSFASLLALQRVLSTPSEAVDTQTNLACLLLIAGGAALSGDLLYAPALAAYTCFSLLGMGLGVVERSAGAEAPPPLRVVLRPLLLGVTVALLGALAIFVLFPRLSWNVSGRRLSSGLGPAVTGFSNSVRLGGSGEIKTNPRIVARITLSPDPRVERVDGYWIGRTYDTFDGLSWSTGGELGRTADQIRLSSGGERLIHQQIELLPAYGAHTALALESPSLVGGATAHTHQGNRRTLLTRHPGEEIRFSVRAPGYAYHAYSLPKDAERDVAPVTGEELDRALATPPGLDPRIPALASRVLGAERAPLQAAQRLAEHLRQGYRYSTELPGEQPDALAHFLFERQEGHCEHFASALVILLRSQGIHARLATGFFGGERLGDGYVLRAGDAHAWTQVFVPERGWVTIDPTPPSYRGARPQQLLAWLVDRYEVLEEAWRELVVDYTIRDQFEFVQGVFTELNPPHRDEPQRQLPGRAWGWGLLAALGILALGLLLERRFSRSPPDPATELHDALLQRVSRAPWLREGGPEDEPLEELSRRLSVRGHPAAPALARAVARYLEARFGGRPLLPEEGDSLLAQLDLSLERHAPARVA